MFHNLLKVKRLSTTSAISGSLIPSPRNCWYLYSVLRSSINIEISLTEMFKSKSQKKRSLSNSQPNQLLIISWRRWGWILCSKTWRLSWMSILCLHSSTSTPSISTSMTTTGILYTVFSHKSAQCGRLSNFCTLSKGVWFNQSVWAAKSQNLSFRQKLLLEFKTSSKR